MMHSMMSSMSPEQLAAMSKASGHELSPKQAGISFLPFLSSYVVFSPLSSRSVDKVMITLGSIPGLQCKHPLHTEPVSLRLQAEMMAHKMQNMSEQQVQQLLKAASWLQRAVDLARKARDMVMANKLFVLGVVVLLIALLLRRMGVV